MAEQRRLPPDDEPDEPRAHQPASEEPADPWASGDETTILRPAGGDRWSGRAGVRPGQPPEAVAAEAYADQAGRRWWAPALVAVITLVLLGVLGVGIWLILRATERPTVPPLPSPTGSTASASASPSPSPTGTRSPTPSPAPTIAVPPVVGLSLADAKAALDRAGLKYQVVEQPDRTVRPNTVVAVAPAPGTEVPVGSSVTLYAAIAPSPTVPPTTVVPTVTPTR